MCLSPVSFKKDFTADRGESGQERYGHVCLWKILPGGCKDMLLLSADNHAIFQLHSIRTEDVNAHRGFMIGG